MKKFFVLALLMISIGVAAHQPGNFYVAAKNGLSMREKKEAGSKVLVKIPYGTKLAVNYPDEIVNISTEGMLGAWAKTTFNGKTGYIVNSYLIPWPPPRSTITTLKQYLPQVSAAAGLPVTVKTGNMMSMEEESSVMKKQLYKNGAEYHEEQYYEANNDCYFLPGFTMQQGFVLMRLIPEFKALFGETDVFPTASTTIKKGEIEYTIKVDKEKMGDTDLINKITIEYADGASYNFEMFFVGSQLVISFGGGV